MTKILWQLLVFILVFIVLNLIGKVLNIAFVTSPSFNLIMLGLPLILLLVHSLHTLGFKRGLILLVLAGFMGWYFESIGLKNGTFFGGTYIYKANQLTIGKVPLAVVCYWSLFIYTGYTISNSFLYWLKKKKPSFKHKNWSALLLLILLDGYIVTAIDLFMDPLQVAEGQWQWLEGGLYFNIPFGNFVGWFIVTISVTGLFRIFEFFYSKNKAIVDKSIF